jgi:uncharacterized protein YajQ (UPF0234 family)
MPSFDIVSEIDKQELDNAINQARKELATRFDFKGTTAEILAEKEKITLTAEDAARLRGLREIMIGKLSKRSVDLRNVEQADPEISSIGHARQELKIRQGLEGNKAKEIIQAIKSQGFKVQSLLQDHQIRVTGKKIAVLQAVIQFVKCRDFGVATNFKNFGSCALEIESGGKLFARLIDRIIEFLLVYFRDDVERGHLRLRILDCGI